MSRFKKAVRKMSYMKNLVISPSGGGKSYTTLRLVTGFAKQLELLDGKKHKVAYINTESGRGEMYADYFDYDILNLKAPYSPEEYIECVDDALEDGYDILVIDSLTHEWSGKGGCLEIHNNMSGKDSYVKWGKVSPRHEAFMDKILDCKAHVFATVRGKDAYERTVDSGGKVGYEKMAIGYDQRKNLEYLFYTTFMIDLESHQAKAVKDNTMIFTKNERLSEKHGVELCNWAYNTTAEDVKALKDEQQKAKDDIKANEQAEFADGGVYQKEELGDIVKEIIDLAKEHSANNLRKEAISLIGHEGNPRLITDLTEANNVKIKLQGLKGE